MEQAKEIVYAVFEVLEFCADSAKNKIYEMSEFSAFFSKASKVISEDTLFFCLSSRLSVILHRAKVLYCALSNTNTSFEKANDNTVREYALECVKVSENTFRLFAFLFYTKDSFDTYTTERNLLFAKVEELRHNARTLRFSLLSGQKKIFRLLPVLEFVYSCTEILDKCEKLFTAFDAVNNKFTLFT